MAFTIKKNLVFIDNMQFMNSSLDVLVKNLSNNDFRFLSQEYSGDSLELLKQWTLLKSFLKINYLSFTMAFTINKNLFFIDNMQFMNYSLNVLVTSLSNNDFSFLSQEYSGDLLELVKQWTLLKRFLKINYLIGANFLVL